MSNLRPSKCENLIKYLFRIAFLCFYDVFRTMIGLIHIKKYFVFVFLCILLGCASSGQISGGPKDTKPPVLITEKSSPNMQRNTIERKFSFTFDEYVEAKDVLKEVLVSPPLVYIPKVATRGKNVLFEFNEKEVLKENTTYIIHFGESIRDFNEGNKFSNFKHVFSTGNSIDSLRVKGTVYDLENNKPQPGVTVLLYEELGDSVIIRKKPFYATKTDKNGIFTLENIKKSTFRIIALKDDNGNLIYNENNEQIGFVNDWIMWDTINTATQDLWLSLAELTPKIIGSNNSGYGICRAKLNTKLNLLPSYTLSKDLAFHKLEMKDDSLLLHYFDNKKIDSFKWILPFDTIKVFVKDTSTARFKLTATPLFTTIGHLPSDTLYFLCNSSVAEVDNSKIIFGDSLSKKAVKVVLKDYHTIGIGFQLAANNHYSYTLLPGAITDYYGNKNDTIDGKVNTFDPNLLSKISIDMQGLDSTKTYIISLMKASQEMKKDVIVQKSNTKLVYKGLKSDEYTLLILEDTNGNGVRDAANYWKKRQAEKSKTFKLEKLRESWELETKIDYKNKMDK
jgi:hypothetical protein